MRTPDAPSLGATSGARGDANNNPFSRYVPLIAWVVVVVTLLMIPLRIISYGGLPGGDARRHIGKAFTDKSYTQILVLRPEYSMDHSPGWEWVLRRLHAAAGWGAEALASFSIVGLMLCVFCASLPWLRRPEAWLAALLAEMVAVPDLITRLTQARPLLLTEGVLIAVLFAWAKPRFPKPSWPKLALTSAGVGMSVWMHGAWYLWALVPPAFFLARRWRDGFWLSASCAAGVVAGALLTGKPVEFLRQALMIALVIAREYVPQWMYVGELQPSYGEFDTLVLLALVLGWRYLRDKAPPNLLGDPVFCLIVIGWVLGFKADRFWADWGIPAALVWLTMQFEELLPSLAEVASPKRLVVCGLTALALLLHATNDLGRRYTFALNEIFLDAREPSLNGWFPDKDGIFYCAQMDFFYNTFYKNPEGNWRYLLGLEPALLPERDLKILRQIQWSGYSAGAYEPWIDEMRPADRLVVYDSSPPNLPRLEWHRAAGNIWLGRFPPAPGH